jgi:hypothetical protein
VHNEIELSFGNVLILLIGLAMTYGMSRAPKSVLKLMSNRYPGAGPGHGPPLANSSGADLRSVHICYAGQRHAANVGTSFWQSPWSSLVTLVLAVGISVFALRKPRKPDLYATLSVRPPAGTAQRLPEAGCPISSAFLCLRRGDFDFQW